MTGGRSTRRTFLAGSAALVGGCLGGRSTPPAITNETDGYPPTTAETPTEQSVDTSGFSTLTVEGTEVTLAPIDVVYYWHQRRAARFADARGQRAYERSHVLGAVLSPAPDGGETDPVARWPKSDRIVCYCGCPHHLSSVRAAALIENGYENVYVLDDGFWTWHDRGYPMAGQAVTEEPRRYELRGTVPAEYAGETAWAWHEPTGQREAAPIEADGSYRLELRFTDVTRVSTILVETPAYTIEAPLGQLLAGTITGESASAG